MLVTILTFSSVYMREKPALEGIAGTARRLLTSLSAENLLRKTSPGQQPIS
mgnify:CR=1 FL=1